MDSYLPALPAGAPSYRIIQMQSYPTWGSVLSPTLMTPERVSTVVVAGCDGPPVPDLAWPSCKACVSIRCMSDT